MYPLCRSDKANALGGLGITQDTRGADKPATSVSWNEAARFLNWLNTSTGSAPAYKFAVQPGEVGYSPNADIELWTIGDPGYNPNNLYRNSLARYFLPSAYEWYKAAYYDPTSGVYYNYPTGSDILNNGISFAGDPDFDAVYYDGGTNPQPNDITNVGLLSPYGTAGQGGNVAEWEETDYDLVNDSSSSARGRRGGNWLGNLFDLSSSSRGSVAPTFEGFGIGFRVASIPEPDDMGDYNHDGVVDVADYVVWRKGLGTTYTQDDYNTWRTNFGRTAGSGAGPTDQLATGCVPEPASLALVLFACVFFVVPRRWVPAKNHCETQPSQH